MIISQKYTSNKDYRRKINNELWVPIKTQDASTMFNENNWKTLIPIEQSIRTVIRIAKNNNQCFDVDINTTRFYKKKHWFSIKNEQRSIVNAFL